jgi:hypothetical protein
MARFKSGNNGRAVKLLGRLIAGTIFCSGCIEELARQAAEAGQGIDAGSSRDDIHSDNKSIEDNCARCGQRLK